MAGAEEEGQGRVGHYARQLTQEEKERLDDDSGVLSDFKRNKLEQEAKKNWDLFYKRNTTRFFKDRCHIILGTPTYTQASIKD